MRRRLLCAVGICGLSWLAPDIGLSQGTRDSVAQSRSADVSAAAQAKRGHEYYVDCGSTGMKGEGSSPATAWSGLNAVNGHTFLPGDVIRIKRGTECHGRLWPKGSGSASASIRLTAYGEGPRPKVVASKGDEEAFQLFDQEYWDVDSIEFSGGTLFGVYVSGQKGILHHIQLRNLLVHDVHGGEVKHKESGLVVISPGKVHQHFDDVLVEGVTAYGTEQWAGILVGGGNFGNVAEEDWSTHVVVRNSVVHDVYGDGIILFRVKQGVIDGSAVWNMGMQPTQTIGTPNAIWTWMCMDCVVSRNEAFLTDSPGVDGGAFDIDYGNTRNSVVDNYGHDTQGYCIAVFGAGYVTQHSVVEGNLCINNGKSPRLARNEGAIFVWTWNDGVIENLRVEKNIIYWSPPGNLPALISRADVRGPQRIFRENQIYSWSGWMIDSNKNMDFRDNRYVSCGSEHGTWAFDGHTYGTFEAYQTGASQDQGSSWKSEMSSRSRLCGQRAHLEELAKGGLTAKRDSVAHGGTSPGWMLVSEVPVSIGADGLLDAASEEQLVVLKNVDMQFRASGLHMKVRLKLKRAVTDEALQNAIRDLSMNDIETENPAAGEISSHPRIRLVAPDGSIAREWGDFAGPAEIGLEVREALGEPRYSQITEAAE